jgi:cytosine/adenosine deaminase-related metal-dependent hydrolase
MKSSREWFPLAGSVSSRKAAISKSKRTVPIDPLSGGKIVLAGRVVTMDDAHTVHPDGVLYIDQACFTAIQDRGQPAPPGFEGLEIIETGGTIFPGLIELHNHLSYNLLPLWSPVPKLFQFRDQWSSHKDYRQLISGPMTVLGEFQDSKGQAAYLPALVRYVECKCLLGGVTTSQGIRLNSNAGVTRYYRGLVRNVEQTEDKTLSEAQARIADIDAKDAKRFLTQLSREDSCYLLHLSEGITDPSHPQSVAREHFLALEIAPDQWALTGAFCGIHSAGLLAQDFDVFKDHGSSMVWSPLSNLLLYGGTARVDAARSKGVKIGIGSDWSPTGSKNLLGELKIAWLYNHNFLGDTFSSRDIVAMATSEAARILKWEGKLGTITAGARADLIVLAGAAGDPYDSLIHARETDLQLVMINSVARYGVPPLMDALVPGDQTIKVGGQSRKLYLKQETADPDVAIVSLQTATRQLTDALLNIASLAKELEKPKSARAKTRILDAPSPIVWSLALDEIQDHGEDLRPRLPLRGPRNFTGPSRRSAAAIAKAQPLSTVLKPIDLDALTVADDQDFLDAIEHQPNVPDAVRMGLRGLY